MIHIDDKYRSKKYIIPFISLTTVLILLSFYFIQTQKMEAKEKQEAITQEEKAPFVIIDPGHGGNDPGESSNNTVEKTLTLKTANALKDLLEKQEIKVLLTRDDDTYMELKDRARFATDANLFISLHYDSFKNSSVTGTTIYLQKEREEVLASKENKAAELIRQHLFQKIQTRDRGIIFSNLSVLRNNTTPAVLIELGYLSNPAEDKLVNSDAFQTSAVEGIANGIIAYLQTEISKKT